MLTLTFELDQRDERHTEGDKARMKLLMSNIQTASRVAVGQLPAWFLPDYEVEFEPQPFARGPCGSVHRGVLHSDTPVVVKCFDAPDMRIDSRTARLLENEMETLVQMDNPNVVKMLGTCHVSTPPFLVCEDAINDDMGSYVSVSGDSKQQRWKLLHQAALGLAYIHSKGIVHGHLKLSNILVGADGQAKLSDFGLKTMRYISKTSTASSVPYVGAPPSV
ncbi:hypothetical protein PHYPSEUDO_005207 [Phytophthora pseudosyringae]|uniref:Protein kinase domain-containing protein n=1 Tax=Phytophthora pseudosyringae TaxID=221518 RepID=A0A8T1VLY7_9STRA|nr:hypothetical protein PHYPSEUDO_005207 [Phytophthora pseudosyringae]